MKNNYKIRYTVQVTFNGGDWIRKSFLDEETALKFYYERKEDELHKLNNDTITYYEWESYDNKK